MLGILDDGTRSFRKMGKNANKKRNRNTNSRRPKGAYQSTDDGDEKPPSFGRSKRNNLKREVRSDKKKFDLGNDNTKIRKTLDADGLEIVEMSPDGNCLFRSLSDQLFGDYGNAHFDVRSAVCDYMEKNKEDFQVFLVFEDENEAQDEEDARDFEHYIGNMRQEGEWGGNLEVVAAARLYQRNIKVYSEALAAFTIDHGDPRSIGSDLLVSYHDNEHYNSVRDKMNPPKPLREKRSSLNGQPGTQDRSINPKLENVTTSLSKTTIVTELEKKENAIQKNVKRSAPCPCGSGLRYKKCCLAKIKHATRMERLKAQRQAEEGNLSDVDDAKKSSEMFRVVSI